MIRVLADLTVAALVAVTLAGEAGRVAPVFDIVNHLRPPLIAALLIALIVAALARAGRVVLGVGAAALALQIAYVAPEVVAAGARAEPAAGRPFVVASHNLRFQHADLDLLKRWVVDEDVDVLMLQEVPWDSTGVMAAFADVLPNGVFGRWNSVLILSRHRLEARTQRIGGWSGSPGGAFPVARAVIPGARPIDLVAVHATHPPPLRSGQEEQFAWLVRAVATLARERTIVAGDFNLTPYSHRFAELQAALGLERATRGLLTFPTRSPVLPIDHVLYGRGLERLSAGRGPDTGSDHLPVIARFVAR